MQREVHPPLRATSAVALAVLVLVIGGLWAWYEHSQWKAGLAASSTPPVETTEHAHDDHGHDHSHPHAAHGEDEHSHDAPNVIVLSDEAELNVGLKLAKVELGPFERTVTIPGMVIERPGRSTYMVSAPLGGAVEKVFRSQGEAVAPGEPLFELRLTHEELVKTQGEFLHTAEELAVVQKEIDRLESASRGILPEKTVLERHYERHKLEARLRANREALLLHGLSDQQIESILTDRRLVRRMTVTATKPGESDVPPESRLLQIHELLVAPGEHVEVGQTLCRLFDPTELYIEGKAFAQDSDKLARTVENGWKVTPLFETGDEQYVEGTPQEIFYTAGKVEPDSRALHFYVKLPNERLREQTTESGERFVNWRYVPGQRVKLRVVVDRLPERIVLPVGAIIDEGAETYVIKREGDHFTRTPVHIEMRDAYTAAIRPGESVRPGDEVAVEGAYQIHLAMKSRGGSPTTGHGHPH
ncbi:MAG: efflux RND transporter periplasmic adaptor subunit [Pirellulales bacterium]